MGCCFSCNPSPTFDCVRVIHINGYVADFEAPVTVGQVTGKPTKHVLCTSVQLLASGSLPYLRPDHILEPGRLYFMLPHTVFRSDSSPAELASLVTRLTTIATVGPGPVTGLSGRISGPIDPDKNGLDGPLHGGRMSSRARTWMPDLSPIQESVVRDWSKSIGSTCELG